MHNIFFICWGKGEPLVGTKNIKKIYLFALNDNYPKMEYPEAGILHDTKNILY